MHCIYLFILQNLLFDRSTGDTDLDFATDHPKYSRNTNRSIATNRTRSDHDHKKSRIQKWRIGIRPRGVSSGILFFLASCSGFFCCTRMACSNFCGLDYTGGVCLDYHSSGGSVIVPSTKFPGRQLAR